jgi:hypothetical protein
LKSDNKQLANEVEKMSRRHEVELKLAGEKSNADISRAQGEVKALGSQVMYL